jgi:hypothetical protein
MKVRAVPVHHLGSKKEQDVESLRFLQLGFVKLNEAAKTLNCLT